MAYVFPHNNQTRLTQLELDKFKGKLEEDKASRGIGETGEIKKDPRPGGIDQIK